MRSTLAYRPLQREPERERDYVAAVAGAIEYWDKEAPGGRFVFTSSAGVFAGQDGGVVTETSPVGSGPRSERLLAAERAVLDAGGCVVRLAGLYLEGRGAHNYWLTQEEVAQRPDGLINQVRCSVEDRPGVAGQQQRGPSGWLAGPRRRPGILRCLSSRFGATLAEPWWALLSTQDHYRDPANAAMLQPLVHTVAASRTHGCSL